MICFQRIILASLIVCSPHSYAEPLVDPTMPERYKAKNNVTSSQMPSGAPYEWVLNSTILSSKQELAIINGVQLAQGEEINGAIVKRINHQQVILSYQNEIITLLLNKSFISEIKSSDIAN
jgi:hypothetical protein